MITGAHVIVYSKDAEADRAFLNALLGTPRVDAGEGWLILRLPPAELVVHPSDRNGVHELYLMTDDVDEVVASLARRGIDATPIADRGWGRLTGVTLPGGGKLGIYEPRHASPPPHPARRGRATPKKRRATRAPVRRRRVKRRRSER